MNNFFTIGLFALLTSTLASLADATPTRTFFAETPGIAADGSVSVDLEYSAFSTGISTGARIGAPYGEVLINNSTSVLPFTSIGYKGAIKENLAAYAILSYINIEATATTTSANATDIALGISYAIENEDFTINLNGEFITDDTGAFRGAKNTIFLKSAVDIPIDYALANSSVIAELIIENNPAISNAVVLGMRWQPTESFTTDLIFYRDVDSRIFSVPGYVKMNLVF